MLKKRKSQNIAEYSILIALIIAAAVGMQTYVKRGLQGRVKNAIDHTGANQTVGSSVLSFDGEQYEPYYAESETDVRSERSLDKSVAARGSTTVANKEEFTGVIVGSKERDLDTVGSD